jgi:8-oxo-dGTP pyrophosphatase MutT (NUDIX family)
MSGRPAAAPLDLARLTSGQPFCAGVVLFEHGRLLATIAPAELDATPVWLVGGVGGGQEPGESIWQCAAREAREELCTDVELLSSPVTYFDDGDAGEARPVACRDRVAPLVLQRRRRPEPERPYRAGLPTGPYLYLAAFLGRISGPPPRPGDDAAGLLSVPLAAWALLEQRPLERSRALWLPAAETWRVVARALARPATMSA